MTDKEFHAWRKALAARLKCMRMEPPPYSTRQDSFELYFYNFATVSLTIYREDNRMMVERYYDAEILTDYNRTEYFPLDQVDAAVERCELLIRTVRNDQPLFEGIQD